MRKFLNLVSKVRIWGVPGILSFLKRELNVRIHGRKLLKMHLKCDSIAPMRGITIVGDLTERSSLSKTLRDFVWCLKDAGIPYQTYDTTWRPAIPEVDMVDLITPLDKFDLHRYTHFVVMYRSPLTDQITKGHTVERIVFHEGVHGIHDAIPFLRESYDEIIAMSDFNYDYFTTAFSVQNVWTVTYPFRFKLEKTTPRNELRRKYGIAEDDFVVFFNFDFGSYYRKNIPAALVAFSLAFKGDLNAKLVFKTKGAEKNKKQLSEMMAKVGEMGFGSQFLHISDFLSRADLDGLTGASDVYLSLHKAEGFGLGMAEAMSQGKPVVVTNWSANTEFCTNDTAWCIPYRMVPILPHEYPVAMKEWADADIDAAAAALREIRDNPKKAQERALRGKAFMEEHFSIANFKADIEKMLEK